MRRCIWCRKYKKPVNIKFTVDQDCCCNACVDVSQTRRKETLKAALRDEIVQVLWRDGPLSAYEIAKKLKDVSGLQIGSIARTLYKKGEIDREPNLDLHRCWQWKALPIAPPPKPKIGRPKKPDPTPAPAMVAAPEFRPAPMMPQAESAIEIKFQKLKRNMESSIKGITDEDLMWQAKYRAQKEWREQRAMN